jgi:hypothetical protein
MLVKPELIDVGIALKGPTQIAEGWDELTQTEEG